MWILSNKKSDHINTLNHTIKVNTSPNGSKHLIEQGGRLKRILTVLLRVCVPTCMLQVFLSRQLRDINSIRAPLGLMRDDGRGDL